MNEKKIKNNKISSRQKVYLIYIRVCVCMFKKYFSVLHYTRI